MTMPKNCIYCDAIIYQENEGLICFQCKPHNLGVKPEIYNAEKYDDKNQYSFSEIYLGNTNYRKMRRENIHLHDNIDSLLD
jgi:hypothetical protein